MDDNELLPHVPRLIKTAKQVFRYKNMTTPEGYAHDVYYDRVSNVFFIEDFPEKGHSFEATVLEDGFGGIMMGDQHYRIRVYEK